MPGKTKPKRGRAKAARSVAQQPLDDRSFVLQQIRELWNTHTGLGKKWQTLAANWYKKAMKGDEVAIRALTEMFRVDAAGRDKSIDLFMALVGNSGGGSQNYPEIPDSEYAVHLAGLLEDQKDAIDARAATVPFEPAPAPDVEESGSGRRFGPVVAGAGEG